MSPELVKVIEAAYVAFETAPPDDLGVCHRCCMEEWIEDDFLNHAPRDLPLNYIKDWYFAAVTSEGGVNQLSGARHSGMNTHAMRNTSCGGITVQNCSKKSSGWRSTRT